VLELHKTTLVNSLGVDRVYYLTSLRGLRLYNGEVEQGEKTSERSMAYTIVYHDHFIFSHFRSDYLTIASCNILPSTVAAISGSSARRFDGAADTRLRSDGQVSRGMPLVGFTG